MNINDKEVSMDIGNRIRVARKAEGLSQEDLGRRAVLYRACGGREYRESSAG
jgi:transcriptional regulator with XRE-family HTH domain